MDPEPHQRGCRCRPAWGPYVRFEHDTWIAAISPIRGSNGTLKLGTPTSVWLDPRRHAVRAAEGVNYRLVMIKPWSWDRHSLNLMLEGGGSRQEEVPPFVQDLGGLFSVRLPAYQLSGHLQPVWRAVHIYWWRDNDFRGHPKPLSISGAPWAGGSGTREETSVWNSPITAGSGFGGGELPRPHLPRLRRGGGAMTCSICKWAPFQ